MEASAIGHLFPSQYCDSALPTTAAGRIWSCGVATARVENKEGESPCGGAGNHSAVEVVVGTGGGRQCQQTGYPRNAPQRGGFHIRTGFLLLPPRAAPARILNAPGNTDSAQVRPVHRVALHGFRDEEAPNCGAIWDQEGREEIDPPIAAPSSGGVQQGWELDQWGQKWWRECC